MFLQSGFERIASRESDAILDRKKRCYHTSIHCQRRRMASIADEEGWHPSPTKEAGCYP